MNPRAGEKPSGAEAMDSIYNKMNKIIDNQILSITPELFWYRSKDAKFIKKILKLHAHKEGTDGR